MDVLIADNEERERIALRLLMGQDSELKVVGEAADVDAMLAEVQKTRPDAVLLNWELPGLRATEALRELRCLHRPVKVVAFGPRAEAQCAALAVGVDAFVSRQEPVERLLNTVRCVGRLSPCFV